MKTRKTQFLLIALLTMLALILSACQVNFITAIKEDGSGVYTQEIGFQGDEASMGGLDPSDPNFCSAQNQDIPPGTSIRQETRNGNEIWCIFETSFATLEDMKAIYGTTDMSVNEVSMTDGKLTYDVTLDLSSDSSNTTTGMDIFWIVTLPGKVIENNATKQDGNTLSWTLTNGQANNIHAVSEISGTNIGDNNIYYIVGGVCLCLCLIVVIIAAGVTFFLLRRRKKAARVEQPVELPVDPPTETPAP